MAKTCEKRHFWKILEKYLFHLLTVDKENSIYRNVSGDELATKTRGNKMKLTRKQLANEIFDLYAKKNNWDLKAVNKKNWVKWLLNGWFSIGYKSLEELTEWRARLLEEVEA